MMPEPRVAVIGLGYVGLPLALAFGRVLPTVGFDISEDKINAYRQGIDPTGEMEAGLFRQAVHLEVTTDAARIGEADFIVVAVPTPVDNAHQPDLTPVIRASETVGRFMKQGAIVVFESTVYPGVTEEVCVPILERESGHEMRRRFQGRLFAGARESRRQGAYAGNDRQGGVRPGCRHAGAGGRAVRADHRGRGASGAIASRWPRRPRSSRTPSAI